MSDGPNSKAKPVGVHPALGKQCRTHSESASQIPSRPHAEKNLAASDGQDQEKPLSAFDRRGPDSCRNENFFHIP